MGSKKQNKNISSSKITIRKGRRVDKTTAIREHVAEDGDHQPETIAAGKQESMTQVRIASLSH